MMTKKKPTHVYLVHEDYWNSDRMHQDPTMMPINAETFKKLTREGTGKYLNGHPGNGRLIVSVLGNCFDNPYIIMLGLE